MCLLVHEASVRLVPPGLPVPSLGATDRASVLTLHFAKPSVFMGNLCGRMKTADEFILGMEKGRRRQGNN